MKQTNSQLLTYKSQTDNIKVDIRLINAIAKAHVQVQEEMKKFIENKLRDGKK